MATAATVSLRRIAGESFRASAWTAAHLTWTLQQLKAKHPGAWLEIIQPCYNVGVKASAGTHDFDCAFDVEIHGLGWWDAQKFLRSCGWAAWLRHTGDWAAESRWHIHMISIPPTLGSRPTEAAVLAAYRRIGLKVGTFIPGQVKDYFAHALGLKGQHNSGSDSSAFPPNIPATVFDYTGYQARTAAAGATMLDLTMALERFAANSNSLKAKGLYLLARSSIGPLVTGDGRVRTPKTISEVIAALEAKRTVAKAAATKARLNAAMAALRPLA